MSWWLGLVAAIIGQVVSGWMWYQLGVMVERRRTAALLEKTRDVLIGVRKSLLALRLDAR